MLSLINGVTAQVRISGGTQPSIVMNRIPYVHHAHLAVKKLQIPYYEVGSNQTLQVLTTELLDGTNNTTHRIQGRD